MRPPERLEGESQELPANWLRRASTTRPGVFYFVNSLTGERRSDLPTEGAAETEVRSPTEQPKRSRCQARARANAK